MRKSVQVLMAMVALLTAAGATGCRIEDEKHADGDNVKIATPFGGMQVKTNDAGVLAGIGLPAYPGATLVKKEKENDKGDDGAADINMSFGGFQLKVKAVSYRTPDSPEKVLAFYRKALGRFGNTIQCDGKRPVGSPVHTDEGLTCDDDSHTAGAGVHISGSDLQINGNGSDRDTKYQLKAGSKKHQHIVDVNPEGNGTRFGLVSLDLPTDFHFGSDDKDKEKTEKQQ